MARITIKMIAERCGLSISTVAYVLREPKTCIAKASTRKLVLDTAREMGYQGNFAAQALRTQKYRAIGILLPWPFGHYSELLMALDKAMKQIGYHGIYSFWEGEDFKTALHTLCNQGVDAIIAAHGGEDLNQSWKPVVTYETSWQNCDCVDWDKHDCIRQALDYLTGLGHTRIGYLGGKADERYTCLLSQLQARNLPIRQDWFHDIPEATMANGFHAMEDLLRLPELPQVIIAHSDLVAQGIYNACHGKLSIPQQLGVISFDNLNWSDQAQPPLTTFDRNYDQTADLLIKTVLARLANPHCPPIHHTLHLKLVERQSVLPPSQD